MKRKGKCVFCGKEMSHNKYIRKESKFCNRKCFGLWFSKVHKRPDKLCLYCKKPIKSNYWLEDDRKFCDRKCSGLWHRNRSVFGSVKKRIRKCLQCGNDLISVRGFAIYDRKKFCGVECYSKYRFGKSPFVFKKIKIKKCVFCGSDIPRYIDGVRVVNYQKRKYCSFKCCCDDMKKPFEERYDKKTIERIIKGIQNFGHKIKGMNYNVRYGKERGNEIARKISLSQLGEKSNNWFGGISFYPYDKRFNKNLKRKIIDMYGRVCQCCGKFLYKRPSCHHLHYDKSDSRVESLVLLCASCNTKMNQERDYWFAYHCHKKGLLPDDVINTRKLRIE